MIQIDQIRARRVIVEGRKDRSHRIAAASAPPAYTICACGAQDRLSKTR